MAVAVPLIMGAMGASATAITLTTVAFAVTGISEKINKAAASVFGEDMVKIGNIFGAAYGMATGFGIGEAAAGEAGAAAGEAGGSGAFLGEGVASGVPAWDGAYNLSDMAGMSDLADGGYNSPEQLAGDASAIDQMGGNGADLLNSAREPAAVLEQQSAPSPMDVANSTQQPQSLLANTQAQGVGAAGTSAAGPNAAAPQQVAPSAAAPNAAAPIAGPAGQTLSKAQLDGTDAFGANSIPGAYNLSQQDPFWANLGKKLMFDDKGNINPTTLRVGGALLAGYGKSASEQKLLDRKIAEERRRAGQSTGLRVTQ